jgi:ATP-dependent Clp protease protease subunit
MRNHEEEEEEAKNKETENMPRPVEEKELFDSRTILISTPVDSKLAHVVNTKLLALEKSDPKKPIFIYINCPGGEVHSGFSIFDTARFVSPDVYTIVSGLAASMGSIIALTAPKERRLAFPNSRFLVHQPSVSGGLAGTVSDIEIHAKDLIDTKNHIISLYAKETGKTVDDIKKILDRDYWMSASQALEFGLISKIITTRADFKI